MAFQGVFFPSHISRLISNVTSNINGVKKPEEPIFIRTRGNATNIKAAASYGGNLLVRHNIKKTEIDTVPDVIIKDPNDGYLDNAGK